MAEKIGRAVLELATDAAGFFAGLDQAEKKSELFGKKVGDISKGMQSFGRGLTTIGTSLVAGITLPIVGIGVAALKLGSDFNAGMANVASLIPGNRARVEELKGSVQDLSVQMGKSTSDLTGGLYQVISAFGDTSDSVAILETNARAATAGLSTTEEAINLTSAVTKGYGDTSAAAVQKVSDLALQTVTLGQTTFPELASSIGRVTPLAAALGVTQEELFGTMATFTGVTGGAAEVSTQLRGVLQALMAPTADMSALFRALGVDSGEAMIQQHGLQGALDLIVKKAQETGQPLQKYISSIEGQTLALSAAGGQHDVFAQKLEAMQHVVGVTDAAFAEQTQGVNAAGFAWQQFKAQLEVAAQRLGDVLLPIVMRAASAFQPLIDALMAGITWLGSWPQPIQAVGVAFAALLAAIGPVLVIVGSLMGAIGSILPFFGMTAAGLGGALLGLLGPFALIAAGLAALTAVWYLWGDQISSIVSTVFQTIKQWLVTAWNSDIVQGVVSALSAVVSAYVTYLGNVIATAASWFTAIKGWLVDSWQSGILGSIVSLLGEMAGFWVDAFGAIIDTASSWFLDVKGWLVDKLSPVFSAVGSALGVLHGYWVKAKDLIVGTVSGIYTGVKEWLVDKFQSIVAGVKYVLDAMTVGFQIMRSKITGESRGAAEDVGQEFMSLDDKMVSPTETAVQAVQDSFFKVGQSAGVVGTALGGIKAPAMSLSSELKKLDQDVQALTASQRAEIAAGIEMGMKADDIASKVGTTAGVVDRYKEKLKESEKAAKDTADAQKKLWESINETIKPLETAKIKFELLTAASLAARQEWYRFVEGLLGDIPRIKTSFEGWGIDKIEIPSIGDTMVKEIPKVLQFGSFFKAVADQAKADAASVGGQIKTSIGDTLMSIPDVLSQAFTGGGGVIGAIKSIGVQIADGITKPILEGLSKLQVGALSAGTAAAAALGGATQGGLGATVAGLASGIGGAAIAATGMGTALAGAGALGAVALGGMTLGIGAAAVGVVALVRHFSGVSEEVKKAREDARLFQDELHKTATAQQVNAAGGESWALTLIQVSDAFVDVGLSAKDADRLVGQLLDTSKPKESKAAMEAINAVLIAQKQRFNDVNTAMNPVLDHAKDLGITLPKSIEDSLIKLKEMGKLTGENADLLDALGNSGEGDWRQMEDAANKYGIELGGLGSKFQGEKLHSSAVTLIGDYDLLTRGGADVDAVLAGMADEISSLVTQSIDFGVAIPENMRPWIEKLNESGTLIGTNGEAITDLGRIQFSPPVVSEFQKIVDKLQELIDKITGPLYDSITDIPDGSFTVQGTVQVDTSQLPEGVDIPGALQAVPAADGGWWHVTDPTLFLAGEAGPEDIMASGAHRRFLEAQPGHGGTSGLTYSDLKRAYKESLDEFRHLISISMRDARVGAI